MAYRFTLADAKSELGLVEASAVCASSAKFIDLVNRSQRMLLRRGDWFDTEWVVAFCVSGCIIAWPRWVGAVRGIRFGCSKPGQLFNNNFSFVGPHHRHSGFHCDAVVEDANLGPTANEVSGTTGKLIRYYTTKTTDIGKTITLFGTQYGGQPLQEQINGVWQNGMTLTAAAPWATNSVLVTRIDAVNRQATDGMAYLYEYDPSANTLRDLAAFEPNDTNPRIRRSRIMSSPYNASKPDANGICWTTVEALIKLEFIPVKNDRDFLMIDNMDALIYMFNSIKQNEAGDTPGAEAAIMQAVREMNFEMRDKNSDEQTPIRVNAVMGRRIKNPY
jgi:hypothetical protein